MGSFEFVKFLFYFACIITSLSLCVLVFLASLIVIYLKYPIAWKALWKKCKCKRVKENISKIKDFVDKELLEEIFKKQKFRNLEDISYYGSPTQGNECAKEELKGKQDLGKKEQKERSKMDVKSTKEENSRKSQSASTKSCVKDDEISMYDTKNPRKTQPNFADDNLKDISGENAILEDVRMCCGKKRKIKKRLVTDFKEEKNELIEVQNILKKNNKVPNNRNLFKEENIKSEKKEEIALQICSNTEVVVEKNEDVEFGINYASRDDYIKELTRNLGEKKKNTENEEDNERVVDSFKTQKQEDSDQILENDEIQQFKNKKSELEGTQKDVENDESSPFERKKPVKIQKKIEKKDFPEKETEKIVENIENENKIDSLVVNQNDNSEAVIDKTPKENKEDEDENNNFNDTIWD